ncbi:gastrula zinc finger protein XlCGF52.1-like [Thrips palmi]|uniref:Gastrula zinc finger protein XlCGF52.1-like n=1 Tax=Thrips palmi TaxID=161013 RepID=A0A6P8ZX66_THRPL|nr:gastrula zinc finger protein XlCGF52.1-like [Thrips palmi]
MLRYHSVGTKVQVQAGHTPTKLRQGEIFSCERCSRSFSYKYNLIKHQRYSCGQAPQFACPVCPLRSNHKWSVNVHMRNRHPEIGAESKPLQLRIPN